ALSPQVPSSTSLFNTCVQHDEVPNRRPPDSVIGFHSRSDEINLTIILPPTEDGNARTGFGSWLSYNACRFLLCLGFMGPRHRQGRTRAVQCQSIHGRTRSSLRRRGCY